MLRLPYKTLSILLLATLASSLSPRGEKLLHDIQERTILQNGQERITDYPDTAIDPTTFSFNTYQPNASEISYKGRWDSNYISYWRQVKFPKHYHLT